MLVTWIAVATPIVAAWWSVATLRSWARGLPAVPDLPDVANPGVIGACTWSPPGPGTVTITPRITYDVTFWANSYTEALDQYVWTGVPVTYRTGDLTAVNTPG